MGWTTIAGCNPRAIFPYTLVFYVYPLSKYMIPKNLTAASTKLIILGILRHGNSYGYLIIKQVKELSGGKLNYSDGMLYPVLHNLEKEGFIKSEWVMEDEPRPRKYYAITARGKNELIAEREHWTSVHDVLEAIWQLKPNKK